MVRESGLQFIWMPLWVWSKNPSKTLSTGERPNKAPPGGQTQVNQPQENLPQQESRFQSLSFPRGVGLQGKKSWWGIAAAKFGLKR